MIANEIKKELRDSGALRAAAIRLRRLLVILSFSAFALGIVVGWFIWA